MRLATIKLHGAEVAGIVTSRGVLPVAALNAAKPGSDADPVAVYNAYIQMAEGAEKDAYLAANAAKIEAGNAKTLNK